jgi:uncharacterized protein
MRTLQQIRLALFALVAALMVAAPAAAQTFPALSGRVVDQAGILSQSTRSSLVGQLAALEAQTTDQLVVATVSSLEGLSIEDYANRLFRHWQLGQRDKNNGVLLLVAPNERKVRIEVGYGLEGMLTDAVSKLIITESIIPHFAAKDMPAGVVQGVDDLVSVLGGDAASWQRRAAAAPARANSHVHDMGTIELPPAVGWVIAVLIFGIGALMVGFAVFAIGFGIMNFVVSLLVAIHVLPDRKHRRGGWKWVTAVENVGSRGSSGSSSSGSSDSFSGGGGSSGGGGASGSW